jgi:hypothetical protein
MLEKCQKENIEYFNKYSNSFFCIASEHHSNNYEVLFLVVHYGKFKKMIKILNIRGENTKHGNTICEGANAGIYGGYFLKKTLAMKCIPIIDEKSRIRAIKEWFLLKIASTVEVAPKM